MLAIVPVKGLDEAKSRLAPALSDAQRRALVARMLGAVLAACDAAWRVTGVLVVTPEPGLAGGRDTLRDPGDGHGPAVELALRDRRARGGALVVMADCPLVTAASLDALVAAARPVALAPARDGGLNAVALADPALVAPAFGERRSADATIARARAAGIEPALVADPALAFDVDRPDDLRGVGPLLAA